jgi:hypothetical protein
MQEVPEQFYLYVLFHELGHCRDDVTRKDLLDIRFDPTTAFDARKMAADNKCIIRGEYAACYFAALEMTNELYRFLEDGFVSEWNRVVQWLREPDHEAKQQAGAIWVQMSEYAKLAAHRAGNHHLHSTLDLRGFVELFIEWEDLLNDEWKIYPNWVAESSNDYADIWRKFCVRCGARL